MRNLQLVCMSTLLISSMAATAKPITYLLDPTHTYPSFEADHMGGVSKWRGKVNNSSGTVVFDAEAKTGTVNVMMQMNSIDFGLDIMNDKAKSPELLNVEKYPTATYKGDLVFTNEQPTAVDGLLSFHGVTKPVRLDIRSWKCFTNPMLKKEACGADAYTTINREEFGMDLGKAFGFDMAVNLAIQVEGTRQD